jgi:hypothetical protein
MEDKVVEETSHRARFPTKTVALLIAPVILLVGVVGLFLTTGGGLDLRSAAPIESLDVERYLLKPDSIELQVRNTGPQAITISQILVNDAVMPFEVSPAPDISRLGRATIHIVYPWSRGEAYRVTVFSGNAIAFGVDIPVAFETPQPSSKTFWAF